MINMDATEKQIKFLRWKKIPFNQGITIEEASAKIDAYKQTEHECTEKVLKDMTISGQALTETLHAADRTGFLIRCPKCKFEQVV